MPAVEIRFYQPLSDDVVAWEFQGTNDFNTWNWVEVSTPVEPCDGCYQATVSDIGDNLYVRARSMDTTGNYSSWSEAVFVTEPSLTLAISICVLLVSAISKRVRRNNV